VVAVLPELKEIRNRRKMLGLTQGELAEAGGLSRTSLSKLENGLADLGYGKVKRLFDVLERVERERALALGLEGIILEGIHSVPVEYVEAGLVLGDVWARMVERGFSQFPVRREGVVVGCVTERMVNRMVFDRGFEEAVAMRVEEIMGAPFPVLDVGASLRLVIPLLQAAQGVLTSRGGVVVGIVTNSDVGKGFR
jgi:predicted transcriptional regulator